MLNTFITNLQIFGIGFSFGIFGPCLFACTPIVITYIAGTKKSWREILNDALAFFFGRLLAYISLGVLAGFSAVLLRQFTSSHLTLFIRPVSGVISIALGVFILLNGKSCAEGHCWSPGKKAYNFGNLFVLGVLVGISPCAPLLTLLFQIALISKNVLDGAIYAFSFGIGTALSGLIVVIGLGGMAAWVPSKFIRSKKGILIFRVMCGLLLIILGAGIIWG